MSPAISFGACRGVAIAFVLFHTAVVASGVVLLPASALLLLPSGSARRAYRAICATMQEAWFGLAAALLRYGLGVGFFIYVPAAIGGLEGLAQHCNGRDVVLVANHRTRIDWMFLWGVCLMLGRVGGMKIVLKDSLKQAPGFGWAMQCFGFIFLSRRNKDADLAALSSFVEYHCCEPGHKATFVLFPEGTDLSEGNRDKSRLFANQNGLPVYEEVLHPKTAGFCAAVLAAGPSAVVLDATMGYVQHLSGGRPNEKDLFTGKPPREVHIRLEVASSCVCGSNDVGQASERLADGCRALFAAKERRLSRFSAPLRAAAGARNGADEPAQPRPDVAALGEDCKVATFGTVRGMPARLAWGLASFTVLEAASFSATLRHGRSAGLVLISVVMAFSAISRLGGVDTLQKWHARRFPPPASAPPSAATISESTG